MIVSRHLREVNAHRALSRARMRAWRDERLYGLPQRTLGVRRRLLHWSVEA